MSLAESLNTKQAKRLLGLLAALLLSGITFWGSQVYGYEGRIAKLETKDELRAAQLDRIEQKQDRMEDKLDRLLERVP